MSFQMSSISIASFQELTAAQASYANNVAFLADIAPRAPLANVALATADTQGQKPANVQNGPVSKSNVLGE